MWQSAVKRLQSSVRSTTGGKTAVVSNDTWEATRLFPHEAKLPIPPLSLQNQVGPPGVFFDVGIYTMGRLNMAGLTPDHDVLDIGCGVGRTARFLCGYLHDTSMYRGFDIMRDLVEWDQQHITTAYPNFQFTFTPLFNAAYQPDRSLPSAATFRFPYPDESFDFVVAHSVFTHLDPEASANYLREVRRVMRPEGRSYATWFLFNGDPAGNVNPLVAGMHLDPSGQFAVFDPDVPDTAVGYEASFVRESYRTAGLRIVEPVHPGFANLQDAIVALREEP
jgi:SAM-dependent methyltransferase